MSVHATVDPLEHYAQFCPSDLVQLDQEERVELFSGEQYGMSQIAHSQSEQYLNNYWRLFHPTFPIIHRFTFPGLESSPMLYAAMITIGAYYGNDLYDKRTANDLHVRCVKLLRRVCFFLQSR